MSPAVALTVAGDQSLLVSRPRGVAHVFVGRLTPSGSRVPRGGRTVCHQSRGVLYVVADRGHLLDPGVPRLCRRCAACLGKRAAGGGVAGLAHTSAGHPSTRTAWVQAYAGVTGFDLAVDAYLAETPAEVDRVRFLGLLVVGWPGYATDPVTSPVGKTSSPLMKHVTRAAARVNAPRDEWRTRQAAELEVARLNTEQVRRQRARDLVRDREAQAEREGRYVPAWARPA